MSGPPYYSPYTYYSRSHQPSPPPPQPSPPPKKIHINPNFSAAAASSSSAGPFNSDQPIYVNVSNPSTSSNATSKVIVNPKVIKYRDPTCLISI